MPLLRFSPAACLLLACACVFGQGFAPDTQKNAAPAPPKPMHSFDLTSLDKTADPCTNFYQYACGNWRKNNPLPSDQAFWNTFAILGQRD